MPGFGDTTFIILLALLLFGPKKLPGLARQLGKLMAEFRRASNEFRSQMEEEFRISEQAERQKQVDALQASAPSQPIPEPEHPHRDPITPLCPSPEEIAALDPIPAEPVPEHTIAPPGAPPIPDQNTSEQSAPAPLPIARSGSLEMRPPSTGLPVANTSFSQSASPSIESESFSANDTHAEPAPEPEAPVHG